MSATSGRKPSLRAGLTGGIASGKSTVGRMLVDRGAALVDADTIVHGLLAAGGRAVDPVVGAFGSSVVDAEGGIDRSRLGKLVFTDADSRRRLERLIHPMVIEESERRLARAWSRSGIVVYEAALLVETGRHRDLQRLIVVVAGRQARVERLRRDRGLSGREAEARIAAQLTDASRRAVADYVIDNGGDLAETGRQVDSLMARLEEDREAVLAGAPLPGREGSGLG